MIISFARHYIILFSSFLFVFVSNPAYAVDICPTGGFSKLCSYTSDQVPTLIKNVITLMYIVAVVLVIFYLVWAGIRWIQSGGDKGKIEQARNQITAAVIGLVIAFLAYFIFNIVAKLFGVSVDTFAIPQLL